MRWVALACILIALVLTTVELVNYSRSRNTFPPGTTIAGVPVGGLDQQAAADRVSTAYALPIELHYKQAVIQVPPETVGFSLDLQGMMALADQMRTSQPFWTGFWDALWQRPSGAFNVPLRATVSEEQLRAYLQNQVAARYDSPPIPAEPLAGQASFSAGEPGSTLNIDQAVPLIRQALFSPTDRVVNLPLDQVKAPRPSLQNLQILLEQIMSGAGFDGTAEIYMLDLQSYQELNFAVQQGKEIKPGIAFSAESTIKIPIMISAFRALAEPTPSDALQLLEGMITLSQNEPADGLMHKYLDQNRGPLVVTADMRSLGLQNTFLAGFFAPGSPLLAQFNTPANSRTDVDTAPDPYNQTTPSELGMLLEDIYQCQESGGGTFAAVFPGQISQNECRLMVSYLTSNHIGVLLEAGLPEGTHIAHKHGWATDPVDGYIHTIGDAGIIFSPSGNYILSVFLYHPVQLVWPTASKLVADISTAVYRYFNLP